MSYRRSVLWSLVVPQDVPQVVKTITVVDAMLFANVMHKEVAPQSYIVEMAWFASIMGNVESMRTAIMQITSGFMLIVLEKPFVTKTDNVVGTAPSNAL
jgi:hypothetical protein